MLVIHFFSFCQMQTYKLLEVVKITYTNTLDSVTFHISDFEKVTRGRDLVYRHTSTRAKCLQI